MTKRINWMERARRELSRPPQIGDEMTVPHSDVRWYLDAWGHLWLNTRALRRDPLTRDEWDEIFRQSDAIKPGAPN